jgi:hypothetical protein
VEGTEGDRPGLNNGLYLLGGSTGPPRVRSGAAGSKHELGEPADPPPTTSKGQSAACTGAMRRVSSARACGASSSDEACPRVPTRTTAAPPGLRSLGALVVSIRNRRVTTTSPRLGGGTAEQTERPHQAAEVKRESARLVRWWGAASRQPAAPRDSWPGRSALLRRSSRRCRRTR